MLLVERLDDPVIGTFPGPGGGVLPTLVMLQINVARPPTTLECGGSAEAVGIKLVRQHLLHG